MAMTASDFTNLPAIKEEEARYIDRGQGYAFYSALSAGISYAEYQNPHPSPTVDMILSEVLEYLANRLEVLVKDAVERNPGTSFWGKVWRGAAVAAAKVLPFLFRKKLRKT